MNWAPRKPKDGDPKEIREYDPEKGLPKVTLNELLKPGAPRCPTCQGKGRIKAIQFITDIAGNVIDQTTTMVDCPSCQNS